MDKYCQAAQERVSDSSGKGLTELWCPSEILKRSPNRKGSLPQGLIPSQPSSLLMGHGPPGSALVFWPLHLTKEFKQGTLLRETMLPWKTEQALLCPIPISPVLSVSPSLSGCVHSRVKLENLSNKVLPRFTTRLTAPHPGWPFLVRTQELDLSLSTHIFSPCKTVWNYT